jgi:hypothetical protein
MFGSMRKLLLLLLVLAGIAQSVQRLATGWTAEGREFESG